MIALTVALATLVGVSLGLLGGGGSILMVPLLAYVAGLDAKEAIATSLLVIGVTSAVGLVTHARADRVRWRAGVLFGAGGMAGAYLGGLLSALVPGSLLLVGFGAVMITAAIAMMRGPKESPRLDSAPATGIVRLFIEGLGVGVVTGLVGAGGGFLIVPALAILGGLPMPMAVGTSLLVIAMNSVAGLAGHLTGGQIDWRLAAMVTVAAVAGALIGSRLTGLVNPAILREAFGWFVLAMASVILAQEIHPVAGLAVASLTVGAGVMRLTCRLGIFCPLRALYPRG
jgi:uncharacterized membrane protein YfcA